MDNFENVTTIINELYTIENEYLNCILSTKVNYENYKNKIEFEIFDKSKNFKNDLYMINLYIKKHNELKTVYSSYKLLINEIVNYRKYINVLKNMSKPLISKDKMRILLDDQKEIKNIITKINLLMNEKKK